jgi:outer membrane protein OmpA-like peptidoglycan-associated protein
LLQNSQTRQTPSLLISSFRICLASAILLAGFSVSAYAQEVHLPAFDGFSYVRDPLFNRTIAREAIALAEPIECIEPKADVKIEFVPTVEKNECPEMTEEQVLSQKQSFELQLGLDKALSQVLKLSVDYETLRTRVQNLDSRVDGRDGIGQRGGSELQELTALNSKRLADRDQQLSLLQTRLDKAQARYHSENASRLLAEKQLKTLQSKSSETKESVSVSNEKLQLFTEQLDNNKAVIHQLEIDLATEKAGNAKLLAEQKQAFAGLEQADNDEHTASAFKLSEEWLIEGLKFKRGSADIDFDSVQSLNVLVEHLKQNSKLTIQVNGYTDSVGSAQSNLRLSQARADSVADYLTEQGIENYRVKTLGYGESRPMGNNQLEQGRLLNRRVAVLFLN